MNLKKSDSFFYKSNRLQQLRGFYYTVRFNSISKAAKEINLTQSTVTLQIQSLERDLGVKLLNRGNKNSFLTKDGEEFYKMACPLIQEFESIADRFQSKKEQEKKNHIKLAIHHIAISYLMPKIIAEFRKFYPKIKISLQNISPNEAISRLKNEEIDLAFYPNLAQNPEVELREIVSYNPILVMNKNHPLKNHEIKSLQDLKKFDLIRIDQNLITLPLFEEVFKTYELKSSVDFENGNWEMLKSLIKQNNFVAILSTICVNSDEDLVSIDLCDFFPKMCYQIATKNKIIKSEIIEKLIEIIKDCVLIK